MARRTALTLGVSAFALLLGHAAAEGARLRLGELAGQTVEIEVSGLPAELADPLLGQAWIAMARAADTLRSHEEAFDRAAGGPVAPEPEAWDLLVRSDQVCRWSEGMVSALGGRVLHLWGTESRAPTRPALDELGRAVDSARCDRLTFDAAARTVTAREGTVVDFTPFARGWAIDRAVDVLRGGGAPTARVRFGPVTRAYGAGPEGKGWTWSFPPLPGVIDPLKPVFLRDRAIALLAADERPLKIAGDRIPRWLNLATGMPPRGLVATAVVTASAADAEALAWTFFVDGSRRGTARANELRPPPAVLWLAGSGAGAPLILETGWSSVPKR